MAQGGDRMSLAMVDALVSRGTEDQLLLAEGHINYALGRSLHDRFEYAEAEPLFLASRNALEAAGSPFAGWPALHLAIIDYQQREIAPAAIVLETLATGRAHRKVI